MKTKLALVRAWFTRPRNRRYLYRVVNASVAAFVVYGLVTGAEAAAALLVVNAVLGLADANVPVVGGE